jgi:hypothetical protein
MRHTLLGIPNHLATERNARAREGGELLDRAAAYIREALGEGTTSIDIPKALGQAVDVTVEDGEITIRVDGRIVCPALVVGDVRWNWMESEKITVFDVYEYVHRTRQADLVRELESKTEELRRLVQEFRGLTSPMARQIANEVMAKVEARVTEIRAELEPLADLRKTWLEEVVDWHTRLEAACRSMAGEDHRRRADEIRKVVGRIVCHFDYRQHGQQLRSNLARVDIEPVDGATASFINGTWPAPG